MERHIGHDFRDVRVHNCSDANEFTRRAGALAMTAGKKIYFGAGWYRPDTVWGRQLLAHELTHVVQQSGVARMQNSLGILGRPGDRYEQEADTVGESFVRSGESSMPGKELPPISELPANAGLQAAEMQAPPLQKASGLLTETEVDEAKAWYVKQRSQYPPDVIKQIQAKVGTVPDGIIGAFTIQAVAAWQKTNDLSLDGKAGMGTLVKMFGKDIRPGAAVAAEAKEVKKIKGEEPQLLAYLRWFFKLIGLTDDQGEEVLAGKEPAAAPDAKKPAPSKYKVVNTKNFARELDGVAVKPSLLTKMTNMASYALENDLVSGDIVFSSGMRSPKEAHRWSTAYQIRQGNVPLKNLQELSDGRDKDGNTWYKPEWTKKEEVQENAKAIWEGALAAEGYPKGDERRKPNTFAGGVTRHATGMAVDATFVWNWGKGDQKQVASTEDIEATKAEVKKMLSKDKAEKVIAAIDKFIARGSFSAVASKTVGDFGLKRPVLHALSSPEDWHYEEK